MFQNEKEALNRIACQLATGGFVLQIIAYGSRLSEDSPGDSDLDVLVVTSTRNPPINATIRDSFYREELATGISFSVTIRSADEMARGRRMGSPLIGEIEREGVIIYDHQP